jgi:Rod binding domain-containing protein
MDVTPLSTSTLAPPAPQPKPTPEVLKAAREFEKMVLGQMLQPMFEGLKTDGEFGGGSGEEMFRPMLIDQYAQAMGKAGGIGLADSIAREMMRLQTTTEPTNGVAR